MSLKAIPPKVMLLCTITVMIASYTHGAIITEDFNSYASKPSTSEFDNGIFHHQILGSTWDISTSNSGGTPFADNALSLSYTQDIITFNLIAGQYIDSISVKAINWQPMQIIFTPVVGSNHTISITSANGWTTYDTFGLGLGNLKSVTLYSNDGAFDDLQVNVVPEPISILLIGAGSLLARRRKRI